MKLQAVIIGLGLTLAAGAPCRASAEIPFGAGPAAIADGEQSREDELYESARQAIDDWRTNRTAGRAMRPAGRAGW